MQHAVFYSIFLQMTSKAVAKLFSKMIHLNITEVHLIISMILLRSLSKKLLGDNQKKRIACRHRFAMIEVISFAFFCSARVNPIKMPFRLTRLWNHSYYSSTIKYVNDFFPETVKHFIGLPSMKFFILNFRFKKD